MMGGDNAPTLRPVGAAADQQPVPAPLLGADRGEGALADVRTQPGWITDPVSNCATSNPFAQPDEEIRWFGACEDGRLSGQGTLVWYVEGIETERNEGTFRAGEFNGEVVTTYPDGEVIVGSYADGVRDGDFTIISAEGTHLRARYRNGTLLDESEMTVAQVQEWRDQRAAAYPGVILAQAASEAPQVTATTPSANSQVVASAPQAEPRAISSILASGERRTVEEPSVQLVRAAPQDRVARAGRPEPLGASDETQAASARRGYQPTAMPRPESAYAQRTAHVSRVLGGVQVAALGSAPAPAPVSVPAAATPVQAPAARPSLSAQSSFAATGSVLIAGDGRPQPLQVAQASQAPVALTASAPAAVPRMPRDSAGGLAQQYAGRDGPWVITSSTASTQTGAPPLVAPRVARAPVAPVTVAPVQATGSRPPSATPTPDADALFSQAYQLELAGRYREAEEQYHNLLVRHPSAPAALLANARLEALQRSRGTVQVAQAAAPPPTQYVVPANSPTPRYSGLPPTGTAGNPALALELPLINRTVCSQNGLYANDARWCGIVTFDEGQFVRVEVTDVRLNAFGQIGITRSTCTGNTFLTWFSRGTSVRVPKRCMALVS